MAVCSEVVLGVASVTMLLVICEICAMSPVLYTQSHDPCYATSTPDETICYSTRCYHLFNISVNGTDPTPQSGYPQSYPAFECVVETYEEYPGYGARFCKKPTCQCRTGYNKLNATPCSPGKLSDCWRQKCQQE